MGQKTKVRRIGNSLGIILPKEMVAHLKVEEGQEIYLAEATDGSLRVTAGQEEFDRQMTAAKEVIRRYRNTLRELAK